MDTIEVVADAARRRGLALLPYGVHFGLDEALYHADPGIGSGDIKALARNPQTYWWESWMNPRRPPDRDTPSRLRGRAMHRLLYEGEARFDAEFARGPDQDPDDAPSAKAARTKAANAAAKAAGKTLLQAEHYDRVAEAAAMITFNPALAPVFQGGMSEVSVIWAKNGVRRKSRIDYLKPRGLGDAKSCANENGYPFPEACRRAIVNYHYPEQATWYLDARAEIPFLVSQGAVYGDYDPEWLKRVANEKRYGWQWVFYQTEGAPITWSCILSPANPICEVARIANERGVANFRDFMERTGPDERWLLIEQPQELPMEELPSWFGR